jgi:RNA polymerase sigma factor for flagellar operon FliA
VKYLAARKARELPAHCDVEDLVSSGLLALLGAIDRFDPSKGVTFEQYVWTRISGAVLDELRRQDWAPRSVRRTQRDVEAIQGRWFAEKGRAPSDAELAAELGLHLSHLYEHFRRIQQADVQSLNEPRPGPDGHPTEIGELLASSDSRLDPELAAMADDRANAWRQAMAALNWREQQIFVMAVVEERHGLEIAEAIGVSQSRISQLLRQIRHNLTKELNRYDHESERYPEAA